MMLPWATVVVVAVVAVVVVVVVVVVATGRSDLRSRNPGAPLDKTMISRDLETTSRKSASVMGSNRNRSGGERDRPKCTTLRRAGTMMNRPKWTTVGLPLQVPATTTTRPSQTPGFAPGLHRAGHLSAMRAEAEVAAAAAAAAAAAVAAAVAVVASLV